MRIEIRSIGGRLLWEGDADSLKLAVVKAIGEKKSLAFANLRGSDLRGSNLSGSDLRGSNLRGSNLRGSNLSGSDLRGSDLSGSNLRDSDLSGSNLRDSNLSGSNLRDSNLRDSGLRGSDLSDSDLRGSNLRGSNLSGSNLSGSDLSGSDLSGSDLSDSDLRGSNLSDSNGNPIEIPIIQDIDAKILEACTLPGNSLDMSTWHKCGTTHCRAGWAITLAGDSGKKLEEQVGSNAAGALIYAASRPGKPVPNFFATDEGAMKDMRACSAEAKQI